MNERFVPALGRHEDIPEDIYLREWAALSSSGLGDMKRSAAYYRWRFDNPSPDTDAKIFGTATHCIILEPERFEDLYRLEPQKPPERRDVKNWRATKDFKQAKAELELNGFRVLKQVQFDGLRRIRDELYLGESSQIQDLLRNISGAEISYAAPHPEFPDVLCKCRADLEVAAVNTVVDVKTTRDATRGAFERAIFGYGYHRTKPFYLDVMNSEGSTKWEHYLFLAVENVPPFQCALYDLDPAATELGRADNYGLIQKYEQCQESGEWPGLPRELNTIGVPTWAYYQKDEEDTI